MEPVGAAAAGAGGAGAGSDSEDEEEEAEVVCVVVQVGKNLGRERERGRKEGGERKEEREGKIGIISALSSDSLCIILGGPLIEMLGGR